MQTKLALLLGFVAITAWGANSWPPATSFWYSPSPKITFSLKVGQDLESLFTAERGSPLSLAWEKLDEILAKPATDQNKAIQWVEERWRNQSSQALRADLENYFKALNTMATLQAAEAFIFQRYQSGRSNLPPDYEMLGRVRRHLTEQKLALEVDKWEIDIPSTEKLLDLLVDLVKSQQDDRRSPDLNRHIAQIKHDIVNTSEVNLANRRRLSDIVHECHYDAEQLLEKLFHSHTSLKAVQLQLRFQKKSAHSSQVSLRLVGLDADKTVLQQWDSKTRPDYMFYWDLLFLFATAIDDLARDKSGFVTTRF